MVRTSDGVSLWTASDGAGPGLLLCNGGPGCGDYLVDLASLLSEGRKVIRWEQRGCGRSDADGRYDLLTVLADMEAIREAYGFDRWVVGGHSWGANVALAYALEHPERTRAVLYVAGNGAQNDRDWHAEYSAARDKEEAPEGPYNPEVNRAGNAAWREYFRRPDFLRRVADLEVPVLFIAAERDIRPRWPMEQLAGLVRCSEVHVVAGAGHYLHATHGAELRAIVEGFMEGLP